MDVLQTLNQALACEVCNARDHWVADARPAMRLNSSIHRLRCAQCGQHVAAKVVGGQGVPARACVHLRREYETLRTLHSVFPQGDRQGTLEPLHYLDVDGYGVMITRWFDGGDLARYARRLAVAGLYEAFQPAGSWLRTLHSCARDGSTSRSLAVARKLEHLADEYAGDFSGDSRIRAVRNLLADVGTELDSLALPAARLHGDFKPGNILHDGQHYVGLDIQWRTVGAVAYDLAPFLNHVWLAGRGVGGGHARRRRELAAQGFLAGYGDFGEPRALQWVRLYFALCHLGNYRRRGVVAARYARWKVWPLVCELADQLRRAT